MNNVVIGINDSNHHDKNQYLESIQNDTKFYKKLLKKDQQSKKVSLVKRLNNNCLPSSSRNENRTQLNNLNYEFLLRHIFHRLPSYDQERVIVQVSQRVRRLLVAESSELSVMNENSNFDMTGNGQNTQNSEESVLQDDINCTIKINNDLYHVGNIITPKVFKCPIYTICIFGVIIGISIVYLFYTVMV